ncbi:MAG: zinc carboxypeptidase, partial [Hydrogenophaga sp.]|nr:zinc carboxypeptidase [Hydrogenophaga sp.]
VCDVVHRELLSRRFSISLDCHSGFGISDRLWFPFPHTREPIPLLAEVHALKAIFEQAHSHHPSIVSG